MPHILLLTNAPGSFRDPHVFEALPALGLLHHSVRLLPAEPSALVHADLTLRTDVVLLDARSDLAGARSLSQLLKRTGLSAPLLLILTEGGMAAVAATWLADGIILDTAGPAETDARIRLACVVPEPVDIGADEIRAGGVVIDEASYSAKVDGQSMNLTYKEFELLKYLAQHPGRVFTRDQLLHEVWGYDYYGGTRTIDVHVRRLRSKLGPDHEWLIATVRNVGYRIAVSENARQSPPPRVPWGLATLARIHGTRSTNAGILRLMSQRIPVSLWRTYGSNVSRAPHRCIPPATATTLHRCAYFNKMLRVCGVFVLRQCHARPLATALGWGHDG